MKQTLFVFALVIATLPSLAQYTKLVDFEETTMGRGPNGSLISDGTYLYGMTNLGGTDGLGTLFKVKPDGTGFEKLLDFTGVANGAKPVGSLYFDGTTLYGMTQNGGTTNDGTVFRILPDGTGFAKMHDFTGQPNGWEPKYGALISDGTYLYGMTSYGGTNDLGVIFRIKPDGSDYAPIHNFSVATGGRNPYGSLWSDGSYFYGMTEAGGNDDIGVIFKILPDGSNYSKIWDFNGLASGHTPYGAVISDGTFLYGMTNGGGANNKGVIFKVMPDGSDFTKLWDFDGGAMGGSPYGSLTYDGNALYGLTSRGGSNNAGAMFRINPDGTGYTKLLDFVSLNGRFPLGSFYYDGTFFYAMTREGGELSRGTVFKFQDMTSAIEPRLIQNKVAVYPNPSTGRFTIPNEEGKFIGYQLTIHNLLGDVLLTESLSYSAGTITVDLSAFPRGIYTIRITDRTQTFAGKLLLY